MVLKRLIPCLLIRDKRLVKTIQFQNPNYIGDPVNAVKIFNDKEVDELIVIDINARQNEVGIDHDLIAAFTSECFMPLTYGGGVNSINDLKRLFKSGVEKVCVNTLLYENPKIVKEAVEIFGSQSIIGSLDVINESSEYRVYSYKEKKSTMPLSEALDLIKELKVGEVLLTDVDHEGTWDGFDRELGRLVNSSLSIPVIVQGGFGKESEIKLALTEDGHDAVALGSMAVYQKKDMGVLIRFPKRSNIILDESPF